MPDSEPPRGDLTPDELDLLRRAAELGPKTADLLAEARECIRRCRELRQEARRLRLGLRASLGLLARWP
jgi:hypothetical protein